MEITTSNLAALLDLLGPTDPDKPTMFDRN